MIGMEAPDFTRSDRFIKPVHLRDLRGQNGAAEIAKRVESHARLRNRNASLRAITTGMSRKTGPSPNMTEVGNLVLTNENSPRVSQDLGRAKLGASVVKVLTVMEFWILNIP